MPITPRQAFNLIQVKKQPNNIGKKGVAEATGDSKFDSMLGNIVKDTPMDFVLSHPVSGILVKRGFESRQEATAYNEKEERGYYGVNSYQHWRDTIEPAIPDFYRKKGMAEGSEWETRHNEFVTVGDKATPEQINKIVKALVGAAQQAGSKRGFLNQLVGKQSNDDLARMAHGAETLAKNIQKNSNAKPGSDERKELGQHLVYAVSLLKRISGKQGVAEHKGVKHKYQMTHPDGSKMKFTATDDADAKRQAKEHGATSLSKLKK
jgi:hypothetical protein